MTVGAQYVRRVNAIIELLIVNTLPGVIVLGRISYKNIFDVSKRGSRNWRTQTRQGVVSASPTLTLVLHHSDMHKVCPPRALQFAEVVAQYDSGGGDARHRQQEWWLLTEPPVQIVNNL